MLPVAASTACSRSVRKTKLHVGIATLLSKLFWKLKKLALLRLGMYVRLFTHAKSVCAGVASIYLASVRETQVTPLRAYRACPEEEQCTVFSVTGLEVIGPNLAFDGHLAVSFADVLDSRHIIFAEVLKGEPC